MEMSGRYDLSNPEPDSEYRYGFNGKEKVDEFTGQTGSTYDFGARMYDARIGRWMAIDPLAGKYANLSPYAFVANNPIMFIDPDGRKIVVPNPDDRETVIQMLNSKARGLYGIDDDTGEVYVITMEGEEGYSEYYRDRIIEGIEDDNTITITMGKIQNTPTLNKEDGTIDYNKISRPNQDIDDIYGGGATLGLKETDQAILISGNPYEGEKVKDTEGNILPSDAADILMHEIVGHAVPKATGNIEGNAIDEDNKVRSEYPEGENTQREADPAHKKCKGCE